MNNYEEETGIQWYKDEQMYIPLLRGINPLTKGLDNYAPIKNDTNLYFKKEKVEKYTYKDLYSERTNDQYFRAGKEITDRIFTGQTIYTELQKKLLGDQEFREEVKYYQEFLKDNIFEGKEVTLIPKIELGTVSVKIEGEPDRQIHELGDGIQSLILLTLPIYLNKGKKIMFFIEEPENNMHPGMQRIFMQMLQSNGFEDHQYFFTTHSNHFLDLAFDFNNISIFMFRKVKESDETQLDSKERIHFEVQRVDPGDIELLKQLGVNNSSVFLSNCTIWVEGISDKRYMKAYIDRELKEKNKGREKEINYVENLHYSFVEYGGNNIEHLTCKKCSEDSEKIYIPSISNKPYMIADFDREGKTAHEQRKEEFGERYYYLEGVKEIENTLHEKVLKYVLKEKKYEGPDFSDNDLNEPKKFIQSEYKNVNLGEFIDNSLKNRKKISPYKSGSTLSIIKADFAKIACGYINNMDIEYDDVMSESAKILAKKLIEHIEKSNEHISNI